MKTRKKSAKVQTGTSYTKVVRKYRRMINRNEPMVMVFAAFALIVSLYSFEVTTGISASMKGEPMYGVRVPAAHGSAEDEGIPELSGDFKDRLCERVIKRFSDDKNAWDRVIERIQKRFGFVCYK